MDFFNSPGTKRPKKRLKEIDKKLKFSVVFTWDCVFEYTLTYKLGLLCTAAVVVLVTNLICCSEGIKKNVRWE
jgi:hypothetical protein